MKRDHVNVHVVFNEPDAVSPQCVLLYVLFLNVSLVLSDTSESSDSGSAPLQESSRLDPPQSQMVSSLRLENQLLRSEVASLNQEMASVIQRAKDLQDGTTEPGLTFLFVLVGSDPKLSVFRAQPGPAACGPVELGAGSDDAHLTRTPLPRG